MVHKEAASLCLALKMTTISNALAIWTGWEVLVMKEELLLSSWSRKIAQEALEGHISKYLQNERMGHNELKRSWPKQHHTRGSWMNTVAERDYTSKSRK